jgi:hypothetical protein
MRLMVGFLVLNCPRVDMVAGRGRQGRVGEVGGRQRARERRAPCLLVGMVARGQLFAVVGVNG